MELKVEHHEDLKSLEVEREKKYKRINELLKKSFDLKNRIYDLRYDESREDEDKEMDLKQLLDTLLDTDDQLQRELYNSTDYLIDQLSLKSVGAEGIFESRKRSTKPSKPTSSTGAFVNASPPLSPRASQETPFYRPPSTVVLDPPKRSKGPINALLRSIASTEEEHVSELEKLEQEIANLRAALFTMEDKKNPTKTQIRMIEDIRAQLKLKISQKETLLRERYANEVHLED
eukprot:TRINITY_DN1759_c0_g1_i1.p1 TRINITY_DN1759_c0_g1~~TRINITY_DN1759_c0_g1_i1.p1  ORF type:complete len:232 (+),score=54.96 TRINITY_DN1759_c0_g1_i1:71-766(+)